MQFFWLVHHDLSEIYSVEISKCKQVETKGADSDHFLNSMYLPCVEAPSTENSISLIFLNSRQKNPANAKLKKDFRVDMTQLIPNVSHYNGAECTYTSRVYNQAHA